MRWCGSYNHRNYVLLYITLNLPCDLLQIHDAGGEMLMVHDRLENRESEVNLSRSDGICIYTISYHGHRKTGQRYAKFQVGKSEQDQIMPSPSRAGTRRH